jgi:hypothetical protein
MYGNLQRSSEIRVFLNYLKHTKYFRKLIFIQPKLMGFGNHQIEI